MSSHLFPLLYIAIIPLTKVVQSAVAVCDEGNAIEFRGVGVIIESAKMKRKETMMLKH
jgi:hypothetical protein